MRLLRYAFWISLTILFVLLLMFAARNTAPVRLRFFFEQGWDVPLILLLLLFFLIGACMGLMASLVRIFKQRREILDMKKQFAAQKNPVDGVPLVRE